MGRESHPDKLLPFSREGSLKKPLLTILSASLIAIFCMVWQPQPSLGCSSQLEGEITVEYRLNKDAGELHAPSGATISGIPRTTRHFVKTKARVCLYEGQTAVLGASHEVDMLEQQDVKVVYKSTDCSPVHRTRGNVRIERPGNWERTVEKQTRVFLEPAQAQRQFKLNSNYKPSFTMIFIPREPSGTEPRTKAGTCKWAGRYLCSFEALVYDAIEGYSLTQRHDVCTAQTTEKRIEFQPVAPGQEHAGAAVGSISPNTTVLTRPYVLAKLPGTFASWHMEFDPRGCSGSHTLFQEKKPHLEQICTVHWEFKPREPCEDLIQTILNDLAYTQAYLDPATRKRTSDIEKYKEYVDEKAYEIHKPESSPWSQASPMGDEIGVNSKCELIYQGKKGEEAEKAYRQDSLRKCIPVEVVEGILRHENTHLFQCRTDKARFNKFNTEIWGNMEAAAYLAGIEHMLNSLKQLCPGYDTSLVEEKIKQINKERLQDRRVP